jgi:hypothetical protein
VRSARADRFVRKALDAVPRQRSVPGYEEPVHKERVHI